MGDSQFMTGLDDKLFYSAWNISQPAEPIPISYWKIKKMAESSSFDTLFISISHQRISSFNDVKFVQEKYKNDLYKRIYPLGIDIDNTGIDIDKIEYLRIQYQNLYLFPITNHTPYIGEFSRVKNNHSLSEPYDTVKLNNRISDHFFNSDNQPYPLSKSALRYIDSIISFTKSKNIETFFIALPVHKEYKKKIPLSMIKTFTIIRNKIENNNVVFLDYTNMNLADSMFLDFDHINRKGSRFLTRKIIENIKAR